MTLLGKILFGFIFVAFIVSGIWLTYAIRQDQERTQREKKIVCYENFQYKVGKEGALWIETHKGVPLGCQGGNRVLQ